MAPNERQVAATTSGIARNMQADLPDPLAAVEQFNGGGDMNGTAAMILHGQSGTGVAQWQVPHLVRRGNYCGTV